jgi:hypothetical protein
LSAQGSAVEIETDRTQDDRPAAYVIAQQYSSVTFVSLRLNSRKEYFDRVLEMLMEWCLGNPDCAAVRAILCQL